MRQPTYDLRHQQVVGRIRRGGTTREIADDLGLSVSRIRQVARQYKLHTDHAGCPSPTRDFLRSLKPGEVKYFESYAKHPRKNIVDTAKVIGMTVMGRSEGNGAWIARIR